MVSIYTFTERLVNLRMNNVNRRKNKQTTPKRNGILHSISSKLEKNKLGRLVNKTFKYTNVGLAFIEYPLLKGTLKVNKYIKDSEEMHLTKEVAVKAGTTAVKQATGIDQVEKAGKIAILASKLYPYVNKFVSNTSGILHTLGKNFKTFSEKQACKIRAKENNSPIPNRFSNENSHKEDVSRETQSSNKDLNENMDYIYGKNKDAPAYNQEIYDEENSSSETVDYSDSIDYSSTYVEELAKAKEIDDSEIDTAVYNKLVEKVSVEKDDFVSTISPIDIAQSEILGNSSNTVNIDEVEFIHVSLNEEKIKAISKFNKESSDKLDKLSEFLK